MVGYWLMSRAAASIGHSGPARLPDASPCLSCFVPVA